MSGTGESPAATRARRALYEARVRAGKTQEEASSARSTSTISRWESGVHEPSWDDLDAYAHELGQEIVLQFGPQTKETPPPNWATGLIDDVPAIRGVVEANVVALAALRAVLEAIQELLPLPDDALADDRVSAPLGKTPDRRSGR